MTNVIKSDYLYSYGFINAAVEDKFLLNLHAVKLCHILFWRKLSSFRLILNFWENIGYVLSSCLSHKILNFAFFSNVVAKA